MHIITVNWNNARQTVTLLRSLLMPMCCGEGFSVVVVDNASSDGSPDEIQRQFREIRLLRSSHNEGYASAVNIGIEYALQAGAEYIWLLNNDTIVGSQTLPALLRAANAVGQPAILSPLIYYADGRQVIWFAGGRLDGRLRSEHIGEGEEDHGQYAGLRKVDWVSGCAPFFNYQVVERAGLWPSEYFLYLEDVDWCLAAREAGIDCYMVGDAPLWHDVSGTVHRLDPAILRYYAWRNYYLLGRRRGQGLTRSRVEADLWWCLIKSAVRWLLFPSYRRDRYYHARTHALLDLLRGKVGIGAWPVEAENGH